MTADVRGSAPKSYERDVAALDETLCLYCQREYASPSRLRTHVLRMHPDTYRALAYEEND